MQNAVAPETWKPTLSEFEERNNLRPTRIEVFNPSGDLESDFWIEDGMLLSGIDIEENPDHKLSVDIMLQAPTDLGHNHLTHRIAGVTRLDLSRSAALNETLEIEGSDGAVTIVRFED